MVFTPLVSPAVTPLDGRFRRPDPALNGDAFSPLTSPAIEARNHANYTSAYETMRHSDTSDTTSPIDLNAKMPTSCALRARKAHRKTMPTPKNPPARSVKQSPAMKPQSRKKQSSTTIPSKEVSGIIEEASKNSGGKINHSSTAAKLPFSYNHESSEAESISPESLSEILMPPPATPKSGTAGQSPSIVPKQPASTSAPTTLMPEEPATPASLMRIRKQAGRTTTKQRGPSSLKEEASLVAQDEDSTQGHDVPPEAAKAPKPVLAPISTAQVDDDQVTPTLSGQKMSNYGTASAPLTATSSIFPSPQLGALKSPSGPRSGRRTELKSNSRDSKKRTNSSSVQVSPALRPRISPSIKPLLPEGGEC